VTRLEPAEAGIQHQSAVFPPGQRGAGEEQLILGADVLVDTGEVA